MTEQFGTFDFGLDEAQEERAARLHRECIIVDALFQGPVGYRVFDVEMNKELRARLESTHDVLGTLRRGSRDADPPGDGGPARRGEGPLGRQRHHLREPAGGAGRAACATARSGSCRSSSTTFPG